MAKIGEIIVDFTEQRTQIQDLDRKLFAEYKRIRDIASPAGRPLNEIEIARRQEILEIQKRLYQALRMMGQDMIDQLENADDLDDLINGINVINGQLEDDLNHLKNIESNAEALETILSGLAGVVKKLTGLRSTP